MFALNFAINETESKTCLFTPVCVADPRMILTKHVWRRVNDDRQ